MCYSQTKHVGQAFKYFLPKQLAKEFTVEIQDVDKTLQLWQLFESLKQVKHKIMNCRPLDTEYNICAPIQDDETQSLSTNSFELAVFALNNCSKLKKLTIQNTRETSCRQLKVSELVLEEFNACVQPISTTYLLLDIIKKSKGTLRSLKCTSNVNLSIISNSDQLKMLSISGNIDLENLEVINTFDNLKYLKTSDENVVNLFMSKQNVKVLKYNGNIKYLQNVPKSTTKVSIKQLQHAKAVALFLKKNAQVQQFSFKEVKGFEAVYLLELFKRTEFSFDFSYKQPATFKICYIYLHPEYKYKKKAASNPNHTIYNVLFQAIDQKEMFFYPYFQAANIWEFTTFTQHKWAQLLENFNDFQICIGDDDLSENYFDIVFNYQISQRDGKYLSIIVDAYSKVFGLGANIDLAIAKLQELEFQNLSKFKRQRFFQHCRQGWTQLLVDEDFDINGGEL